jgi:hypothetical protein
MFRMLDRCIDWLFVTHVFRTSETVRASIRKAVENSKVPRSVAGAQLA